MPDRTLPTQDPLASPLDSHAQVLTESQPVWKSLPVMLQDTRAGSRGQSPPGQLVYRRLPDVLVSLLAGPFTQSCRRHRWSPGGHTEAAVSSQSFLVTAPLGSSSPLAQTEALITLKSGLWSLHAQETQAYFQNEGGWARSCPAMGLPDDGCACVPVKCVAFTSSDSPYYLVRPDFCKHIL